MASVSMPPLSSLAGRYLMWRSGNTQITVRQGKVDFYLFDGQTVVATARAGWQRLRFYDLTMGCAEGEYQVHVPANDPGHRPAVAWKVGESVSLAGFELVAEGSFTVKGWVDTASGRRLVFEPTQNSIYEYVLFAPDGPRLITVQGFAGGGLGGTAGYMLIAPEASAEAELPALVALSFALACEQVLRLHRDAEPVSNFIY